MIDWLNKILDVKNKHDFLYAMVAFILCFAAIYLFEHNIFYWIISSSCFTEYKFLLMDVINNDSKNFILMKLSIACVIQYLFILGFVLVFYDLMLTNANQLFIGKLFSFTYLTLTYKDKELLRKIERFLGYDINLDGSFNYEYFCEQIKSLNSNKDFNKKDKKNLKDFKIKLKQYYLLWANKQ